MEDNQYIFEITINSDVIFFGNGKETLKLCSNGDIFVKGSLCENDKDVVDEMRAFLSRLK